MCYAESCMPGSQQMHPSSWEHTAETKAKTKGHSVIAFQHVVGVYIHARVNARHKGYAITQIGSLHVNIEYE